MPNITGSFSGRATAQSAMAVPDVANHEVNLMHVSGVQRSPDDNWNNTRIHYWGISDLLDAAAQLLDQLPAAAEIVFLAVQDAPKPALLEGKDIDSLLRQFEPCRIAYDIDQTIERVQPAQQIVILPV